MRNPRVLAARQRSTSMSAPIGGLNVRDAIQSMPSNDAIELVNWIAQQYGVRSRKGWKEWATGLVDPVRTVMVYQPDRQDLINYKLFGVTDGDVFDVTASTASPSSVLTLPDTDNYGYFSWAQYSNAGGNYLICASNEGQYRYYNGTAWSAPTMGVGAGQISNVDPADLCFVTTWKSRIWFIQKESTKAWYLATSALVGPASSIDIGPFIKKGGKLAFIANWTIDAGEGVDDFLVLGSENGEILLYKGTNPDDPDAFGLVGNFYVGALPVGRRPYVQLGGDLLVLSELGIQPLSYVTRGGQSLLRASSVDYLGKIQPRLAELVSQYSNFYGWSLSFFPRESLMIVDVPTTAAVEYTQYVLYTNTNTWSLIKGVPMNGSMCIANNQMYFGTDDGRVCLAYEGYFDNVPLGDTVGDGVYGKIQPSYNYFGTPGVNKQFLMVRPTFMASDRPSVVVTMLADFKIIPATGIPITSSASGSLWDVSHWDEAVWGGSLNVYADWYGAEAVGYTGSLVIDTTCPGDTFLASIDYLVELGGVL